MSTAAKAGIAALVLLAIVGLTMLFMHFWMAPPDDLDLSREKPSANKVYMVAVAPEREPLDRNTLHAWIATVKAADGSPVEDARISVDGGMPQHGHGLPTAPAPIVSLPDSRRCLHCRRGDCDGEKPLDLPAAGKCKRLAQASQR